MLVWAHQDREEIERSESAVCDFSTQLAESYEELSLLYKLGQSMGELVNPQGFIRFLCEELFATIQYAWFGAWISPACGERAGIARRCFLVGEAPAEAGALRDLLDRKGPEWLAAGPKILAASDIGVRARNPKSPVLAHPLMRAGEVVGALLAGSKLDGDEISSVDMKLLDAAGANLRIFLENTALYAEQRSMFVGTLHALTAAIDAKDSYTSGHSERVAHLSRLLAEAIGLDAEQVERIEIAGLVHDIGKIGVPERVLCKSGRLTDEEFELIKLHPRIGRNILKDIPQMTDLLPAVLSHHERWDGRGYPEGLIREQIPLHARIVALADSFDAMSSTRTYRAAMQRAAVLREIERCAGSQFDPDLAPVFVTLDFSRYDEMVRKHLRSDGRLSSMGDAA
jgi:HD-GYP domain-containing protein (c-di-GMP phosphodiesterase class II)